MQSIRRERLSVLCANIHNETINYREIIIELDWHKIGIILAKISPELCAISL